MNPFSKVMLFAASALAMLGGLGTPVMRIPPKAAPKPQKPEKRQDSYSRFNRLRTSPALVFYLVGRGDLFNSITGQVAAFIHGQITPADRTRLRLMGARLLPRTAVVTIIVAVSILAVVKRSVAASRAASRAALRVGALYYELEELRWAAIDFERREREWKGGAANLDDIVDARLNLIGSAVRYARAVAERKELELHAGPYRGRPDAAGWNSPGGLHSGGSRVSLPGVISEKSDRANSGQG